MRIYAALLFVVCSFATVTAQKTDQCSSAAQQPSVTSLRSLNAAEMSFAAQRHRFAPVSDLLADGSAKKFLALFGSGTDPLPGYTLDCVVSADGKSYAIILTQANGACSGFGATTNEKGVISLLEPLR